MRLWLSKNSEVPLREQLVTQIILGVTSKDLKPNERLPSTRDLARRYNIHSNTVSAAYRELATRGWVEFRKGSGVYIRSRVANRLIDNELALDELISTFFNTARVKGHSLAEIQTGLKRWLSLQPPDHFLLIEPDKDLRHILAAEIEEATGRRVVGVTADQLDVYGDFKGGVPLVLYSQSERVRARLPSGAELVIVHSQSVPESMSGQTVPSEDELVAVVSCWPDFLRRARAVLVAAGINADALTCRDTHERGWEKGLSSSAFVITDSVTAKRLPKEYDIRVFRIISDDSIIELQDYVARTFR
jgi:GntR family transcriptional regulator